ncbi:lipocalin family protein [Flavobacterium crassostreae]|uniref:lipocalin family protein n=1 Tax=Flavobacterium crassostreae TaxID=1763534 RepID=UPI0008A51B37|nr:lipocalin family protein [Flavobacterium crassostreae]
MKNSLKIMLLCVLFAACQQKIQPEDLHKINGYWEIEKVVFETGEDKGYQGNTSYDYFKITKNKGIRKKVMPQLDGSFVVNNTFETVAVRYQKNKVYLDYATQYAKWTEELVALSDTELVCKNADQKEYHYKKSGPINLTQNGKETK